MRFVGVFILAATPAACLAQVSVMDFGAAADGVTDDRAAVQAALDSGEPVIVPSGSYRLVIGGESDRVNDCLKPRASQTITVKAGAILIWEMASAVEGEHWPLFLVHAPRVAMEFEAGSCVVVRGNFSRLAEGARFGLPMEWACSVVWVGQGAHWFQVRGMTVRGDDEKSDDYNCAVFVHNAIRGSAIDLDIRNYGVGIRLTNRSIAEWTLRNIHGDYVSQSPLLHFGPSHLIYSLTADRLLIDGVTEGPHCMNNHVGERAAPINAVIPRGRSGHTIKVVHAHRTYARGLRVLNVMSENPNGVMILGGAIYGGLVEFQWSSNAAVLHTDQYSPLVKGAESNNGATPRHCRIRGTLNWDPPPDATDEKVFATSGVRSAIFYPSPPAPLVVDSLPQAFTDP